MEKIVEQGMLYDFYGELLTDHQKRIYENAVYNDLSLAELAAENQISRQAIHDIIKRCDRILLEYESKLHLVEKFGVIKKQIHQLKDLSCDEEVSQLCNAILEEL